jgi:hypothetical protein
VPHLIYGSPLLLILCIYLWQQRGAFWHYGARALLSSFVLLAAFTVLIAQAAQTRVTTRRGTIYTFTRDSALDFLDQQVTTGQEIFVYPYYPMYYFLSATRNATRFSILMYHINTTAQFREAMADLERRKARYVLWDTAVEGQNLKQWFPGYEHPRREELLIEPYLKEHYDLVGYKDSFRVLVRRDEASVAGNGMRAAFPGSEMERQLMLR